MFANHPAFRALKDMGALAPLPTRAMLDSAAAAKTALLDATAAAAAQHTAADLRATAARMVREWAATPASDLDDGETMADRLLAMAIGIADENKDGEITPEEADVIELALNAMADYLYSLDVSEADVIALLQETDAEAGDRVAEFVAGAEGDDDVDAFAFDAESSESVLDSMLDSIGVLDATYKKALAIRKGKKVRINKRVAGHVRLSSKQKVAIRKAGLKSRSATAKVRRLKSAKLHKKMIG